jgi:uncharacterized membrane protein
MPADERKGFAFPAGSIQFLGGSASRWAAEPPKSLGFRAGKAKPFRSSGGTAANLPADAETQNIWPPKGGTQNKTQTLADTSHTVPRYEHPVIALLLVQSFFGSLPVIAKVVLPVLPPMSLVGFRVGITALVLFAFQLHRGRLWLRDRSDYLRLAVLSLFGVVFNQLLFIGGLSRTKASNTSLLAVTIPIFTLIVAAIAGSERIARTKIIGIALAAAGIILLIDPRAGVVLIGDDDRRHDDHREFPFVRDLRRNVKRVDHKKRSFQIDDVGLHFRKRHLRPDRPDFIIEY